MIRDITSVVASGLSTPINEIYSQIEQTGWQIKKVKFDKKFDAFVATATNSYGEQLEKMGNTDAMALANLLYAVLRHDHMRTAAQWKIGMWSTTWTDKLPEIAEAYAKAPVYDPKAAPAWKALADDSTHRAQILGQQLKIEVVDNPEPYPNVQAMADDVHKNRHFYVSRANAEHPVWTPDQNVAFRTVHDVLGHVVSGGDFGWQGENMACAAHFPLLNPLAQQALFTECIAQTGYAVYYRGFGPQKVAFLMDYIQPAQEAENPAGHQGIHPSQVSLPTALPEYKQTPTSDALGLPKNQIVPPHNPQFPGYGVQEAGMGWPVPIEKWYSKIATTRSLYHGTLLDHLPSIQQYGLIPDVGPFTSDAYGITNEYEPNSGVPSRDMFDPAVMFTDRQRLDKALTAMRHNIATKLDKDFQGVTPADIRNHGLLVKQPGEMGWSDDPTSDKHLQYDYVPDDNIEEPWETYEYLRDNGSGYTDRHPYSAEPGDFYSTDRVGPGGLQFIHGPALLRVLHHNGLMDSTGKFSKISALIVDPNYQYQTGFDPHPSNAYLWHGDPLESQEVMNNARLVDTNWSNLKTGEGEPDIDRMKQAIVNAFRVVLLSPRKDLRWNAIHYQDISHIPATTTDPAAYWNALEQRRQEWNVKRFGEEARFAHLPYAKFVKPFENIIFQMDPQAGYQAAKDKAQNTLFDWISEEQERIMEEDKDKPSDKQKTSDEVERKANQAVAKRLKMYIKDFQPKLDFQAAQDSLFDMEPEEQPIQPDRYGAWMGTHLKAISKISQHSDELLKAALEDVHDHDGAGHHFRAKVLQLGISGVGPKVASFAWLLLQPMTSQLATIDTHMMDVLGHKYEKDMNTRDYFKYERELQAGRDAAGYAHIPLGAFQWGMWDNKRTGQGSHQDHSAMRVLDPIPHDSIDWASKAQNLKGQSWTNEIAPQWWKDTEPYREQVAQDWDQNVAPSWAKSKVPYNMLNDVISKTARDLWQQQNWWYNENDYRHLELTDPKSWKGLTIIANILRQADSYVWEGVYSVENATKWIATQMIKAGYPRTSGAISDTVNQFVEAHEQRGHSDLTVPEEWTAKTAAGPTYWHITHDPNFQIDPQHSPGDYLTPDRQEDNTGALMFTDDPHYWASMFHSHPEELGSEYENNEPRQWAAEIEPGRDFWPVNRGFGSEYYMPDATQARVRRVIPLADALREHDDIMSHTRDFKAAKVSDTGHKTKMQQYQEQHGITDPREIWKLFNVEDDGTMEKSAMGEVPFSEMGDDPDEWREFAEDQRTGLDAVEDEIWQNANEMFSKGVPIPRIAQWLTNVLAKELDWPEEDIADSVKDWVANRLG